VKRALLHVRRTSRFGRGHVPELWPETRPDARFCNACATPLAADERAVGEERKTVTVGFVDLVGFTARWEALDPRKSVAGLGVPGGLGWFANETDEYSRSAPRGCRSQRRTTRCAPSVLVREPAL
jgi:hypothetical protein